MLRHAFHERILGQSAVCSTAFPHGKGPFRNGKFESNEVRKPCNIRTVVHIGVIFRILLA
jgi:hypothetical protein